MTTGTIDMAAPIVFVQTAFESSDWVAVLLKSFESGQTTQRVLPVTRFVHPRLQAWLRAENAARRNLYLSVNALQPDQHSRRRDAVAAVRHLFLDVDTQPDRVLAAIERRDDVPSPSYVLQTSPGRAQVLWRVTGFTSTAAEAVQKRLARELGTDRAATSCAQMMRVPGAANHKYVPGFVVSVTYVNVTRQWTPREFGVTSTPVTAPVHEVVCASRPSAAVIIRRARRYLASIPPAIAGQHGDAQTFRACCRLVRGFTLTDEEALELLVEWNARCKPPWSERDLRAKLRNARRYGHEPVAALLEAPP